MKLDAVKLFLVLTAFVFVALNVPGRLVVDGTTKTWFAFSVPEQVQSYYWSKMSGPPPAQLKRGWPWVFQADRGYEFITKEGRTLFLSDPNSPSVWQRLSICIILANLAVSSALALIIQSSFYMLRLRLTQQNIPGGDNNDA